MVSFSRFSIAGGGLSESILIGGTYQDDCEEDCVGVDHAAALLPGSHAAEERNYEDDGA